LKSNNMMNITTFIKEAWNWVMVARHNV
jgi:hypothetical protein